MKKIILFFSFIIILSISINPVYGQNQSNDSILIISFKDKFGQTIKEDIILEGHINEEYKISNRVILSIIFSFLQLTSLYHNASSYYDVVMDFILYFSKIKTW